jgi:hypothetical protein
MVKMRVWKDDMGFGHSFGHTFGRKPGTGCDRLHEWGYELLIESNSLGICTGTHSFKFSTSFLNRKLFSV